MSHLRELTLAEPRPLPVILLADASGSMAEEGKIMVLNQSIKEMARDFAALDDRLGEIQLGVISFGGRSAEVVQLPVPARELRWEPLRAHGKTPLGAALDAVRELIEDRTVISSRAYRPTLVLISDGQPNDDWEAPLARLLSSERAGKAFRVAIAIGASADRDVLRRFTGDPRATIYEADQATDIKEVFRLLTMSVSDAHRSGDYQTLSALEDAGTIDG